MRIKEGKTTWHRTVILKFPPSLYLWGPLKLKVDDYKTINSVCTAYNTVGTYVNIKISYFPNWIH